MNTTTHTTPRPVTIKRAGAPAIIDAISRRARHILIDPDTVPDLQPIYKAIYTLAHITPGPFDTKAWIAFAIDSDARIRLTASGLITQDPDTLATATQARPFEGLTLRPDPRPRGATGQWPDDLIAGTITRRLHTRDTSPYTLTLTKL